MALSPQRIRESSFKSVRRGYDPGEVDSFVQEVAGALEAAQNDATAMEARARAAVARLQELSQSSDAPAATAPPEIDVKAHVDEAETISRALLLAQRTADQTVADAQAEADRVLAAAQTDAAGRLDGARSEATQLIEEAKVDARRDGEAERVRVEGEVQALLARRDFLESDVDHLEQFLMAQRERITEAVSDLQALVNRVPSGLADMRRPLLSAVTDNAASSTPAAGTPAPSVTGFEAGDQDHEGSEISEITRVAEAEQVAGAEDDDGLPPPEDVDGAERWDRTGP